MEKFGMRTDYILYVVAIIFFAITGIVAVSQVDFQSLWIVGTAVLGLFFIGLGYTQKPSIKAVSALAQPPPSPTPAQIAAPVSNLPMVPQEVKKEEAPVIAEITAPPSLELTQVKGVKQKRALQLKALGINSVHDLAGASAEDLATKLKISPKFTQKWIDSAKELIAKP